MRFARMLNALLGRKGETARVEPKMQPSSQAVTQGSNDTNEHSEPDRRLPAKRVTGLIERVQWSATTRR